MTMKTLREKIAYIRMTLHKYAGNFTANKIIIYHECEPTEIELYFGMEQGFSVGYNMLSVKMGGLELNFHRDRSVDFDYESEDLVDNTMVIIDDIINEINSLLPHVAAQYATQL